MVRGCIQLVASHERVPLGSSFFYALAFPRPSVMLALKRPQPRLTWLRRSSVSDLKWHLSVR